jgi:TRAP-type mannitol/chloroaromatic compound transport system substrate-binding protein
MKILGRTITIVTAAFAVASIDAAMSAVQAQSAPVNLVMVGAWKPNVSPAADIGIKFKDTVNKMSGGKIQITFKGADDVIPTFDQPEALVKGVFDIWYGAPNYWAGIVKGGYVTEMSPFEIPDNGPSSEQFAFINKLYEAHGVHYLGHMTGEPNTGNHFLYTQKRISKIEDLKGMKIRVPPLTRFFVTSIGAEPVTLPPGDIYLALERGTVDGFTWPYFDEVPRRAPALSRWNGCRDQSCEMEQPARGRQADFEQGGRGHAAVVARLGLSASGGATRQDDGRRHETD